jgi:hypothetical protein
MPSTLRAFLIRLKFSTLRMRMGILTILIMSFCSVSFAVWDRFDYESQAERNIASEIKMQVMTAKHQAPVNVQIDSKTRIPEYDHQELTITGYVTLNKDVSGEVRYVWEIPEGTNLVSGDESGSWTDLKAGQTAAVVIHVTGFSKESLKHIILKASVKKGTLDVGHSALMSSRPEDSMEYIAPEIREHVEKVQAQEFPRGRLVK